jgi:hypothetical protein
MVAVELWASATEQALTGKLKNITLMPKFCGKAQQFVETTRSLIRMPNDWSEHAVRTDRPAGAAGSCPVWTQSGRRCRSRQRKTPVGGSAHNANQLKAIDGSSGQGEYAPAPAQHHDALLCSDRNKSKCNGCFESETRSLTKPNEALFLVDAQLVRVGSRHQRLWIDTTDADDSMKGPNASRNRKHTSGAPPGTTNAERPRLNTAL